MDSIAGFKFRLYPNKEQAKQFNKNIGCCRWVYNWALGLKKNAYEVDKINLSIRKDIRSKLPILKKTEETSFLAEADACALASALENLDDAYTNFFKEGGFPKFKKRTSAGSFTLQIDTKCFETFNQGYIKIGKAGLVRVKNHRALDISRAKSYVTISRNTIGEYYIAIKVHNDMPDEPTVGANEENTIGVDMGVHTLAITNDGTKYHKFVIDRKLKKKKRRLQRALARKAVFSSNGKIVQSEQSSHYKALQKQIAKIDVKIARQREYYQYEVANNIVNKDCLFIGIEDLNVKGMSASGKGKRKKLTAEEYASLSNEDKKAYNRKKPKVFNKSVMDQSLGSLRLKIENKAKKTGKKVIEVDRFYASSQMCSNCGYKNIRIKNTSIREWVCPICGTKHDRDINAAINIKNKVIDDNLLENRQLPRCTGKVMSPETKLGETKQNRNFNENSRNLRTIEGENTEINKGNKHLIKDIDNVCC